MFDHEDAPREVTRHAMVNAGTRRVHPMVIVASGAVTLFCAIGIGVMTGLIPSAHSLQSSRVDGGGATPPIPLASHASAPIGTEAVTNPAMAVASSTAASGGGDRSSERKTGLGKQVAKPGVPRSDESPKPGSETERASATAVPPAAPQVTAPQPAAAAPVTACANCGVVDGVLPVAQRASASGAGAVVGGVLGGVLGRQVGKGRGRDLATVAGAVGGAVLGHSIEKNAKSTQVYDVRVRMEDGSYQTVREDKEPGVRVGDRVRIESGRLVKG